MSISKFSGDSLSSSQLNCCLFEASSRDNCRKVHYPRAQRVTRYELNQDNEILVSWLYMFVAVGYRHVADWICHSLNFF